MAGIEEGKGKGRTPKEVSPCGAFLGRMVKKHATVISWILMGRYLKDFKTNQELIWPAN